MTKTTVQRFPSASQTCLFALVVVGVAFATFASFMLVNSTQNVSVATRRASEISIASNMSSVDYIARCGLGHRLARMANAALVAKELNLTLRSYWGLCEKKEVFQHLFESDPQEQSSSLNQHVRFSNDVPGMKTVMRQGPKKSCLCRQEYIDDHYEFYLGLRNRFRFKERVDAFVERTFANHTVLGIHIRAGNGETGDFTKKGRGISNLATWVHEAASRIKEMKSNLNETLSPFLLYIATDTPSMIETFRSELAGVMPVVDFPQERAAEGQGVLFGETGAKKPTHLECMRGWEDAVMDMILLSYADILIASRMSSFVQTMPMSLVFGRNDGKIAKPNCELNFEASKMICSSSYLEWCCNISQSEIRPTFLKESLKFPPLGGLNMSLFKPQDRPFHLKEGKDTYLPLYWRTDIAEESLK